MGLSAGTSGPGESKETTHTFLLARKSCGLTFSKPRSEVRVLQELREEKRGGCDADVRRAVEPRAHLPGDRGIRQDLAQSERGGGAAGVLANESCARGEPEERGACYLRVSCHHHWHPFRRPHPFGHPKASFHISCQSHPHHRLRVPFHRSII